MSHITLLEYVTKLQNLGLTQPQINAAVAEFKKTHALKKPVETKKVGEELKGDPAVAEKKDTTAAAKKSDVSD